MLLKDYEQRAFLFNSSLTEACSDGKLTAYRGDLIILEGEIGDAQGRRKPPVKLLLQTALLATQEKLTFLSGLLADVADLHELLEKFGKDMTPETLAVLFVVNIDKPVALQSDIAKIHLIPLHEGLAWTELMELAGLDKGDTKGLSSADKVLAIFKELGDFKARGSSSATVAQTMLMGNGKQREIRGAI
jgi:hypothetical protein